jgi:hypothetical protein
MLYVFGDSRMNTSDFIGSCEEIRDLSQQDQLEILEQVRIVAFSELKLGGQAVPYLVLILLIGVAVTFIATIFTTMLLLPIWIGLSVLASAFVYQRLMKKLLHKGLSSVLKSRDV